MMVSSPHSRTIFTNRPFLKFIFNFACIAAVLALQFVQQLDDIGEPTTPSRALSSSSTHRSPAFSLSKIDVLGR